MTIQRITPEELWSRQQISSLDTDYKLWDKKRTSIQAFSQISPSCIFTVDSRLSDRARAVYLFTSTRRKERLSTGISNSYAECTATICKCHQSPPGRPKGQERQGLLSKEIAYKLHLSIYTVNNHRKHILSKLQAGNAIEAINRAEDYGLLY